MEGKTITMQDIFLFQQHGHRRRGQGDRQLQGDRHPAEVRDELATAGMPAADGHVRAREAVDQPPEDMVMSSL